MDKKYICPLVGVGTEQEYPAGTDILTWWWEESRPDSSRAVIVVKNIDMQKHENMLSVGCVEVQNV